MGRAQTRAVARRERIARLEQGGGPIPVLLLDIRAAEQPRGFGVGSVGKEVREELPGLARAAGS